MSLADIISQLKSEETALAEQLGKLQVQTQDLERDLEQVRSALQALGEKRNAKSGTKTAKPAVTKQDVVEAIRAVLGQEGELQAEDLKTAVSSKLSECGKSRQGLGLRFKQALQDARFVVGPGGYRLGSRDSRQESSFDNQ